MSPAANYSARRLAKDGIETVRLTDAEHHAEVSIVPSIGNNVFEFSVNGKNLIYFPVPNLIEFREKKPFSGIPFLAPWANRIDQHAYYANDVKYLLNQGLNNYKLDHDNQPEHGLLCYSSAWQVVSQGADSTSAHVTSRLEFWKHPDLMAQFPFAHNIEMTYRLSNGALEVILKLQNLSADAMPVAIGFHPYFQLDDAPRDEWTIHIAANDQVVLNPKLTPTGELKPMPYRDPLPLNGVSLDDVFTGLRRGAGDKAEFWVQAKNQKISVIYGPKYKVAVIYAPPRHEYICFEPMAAITNAFNLAHEGKYHDLQSIPAGEAWAESFWIKPSGF